MSECLGDVDNRVQDLRGVGGVEGRLPTSGDLQATLELQFVVLLPPAHGGAGCRGGEGGLKYWCLTVIQLCCYTPAQLYPYTDQQLMDTH